MDVGQVPQGGCLSSGGGGEVACGLDAAAVGPGAVLGAGHSEGVGRLFGGDQGPAVTAGAGGAHVFSVAQRVCGGSGIAPQSGFRGCWI